MFHPNLSMFLSKLSKATKSRGKRVLMRKQTYIRQKKFNALLRTMVAPSLCCIWLPVFLQEGSHDLSVNSVSHNKIVTRTVPISARGIRSFIQEKGSSPIYQSRIKSTSMLSLLRVHPIFNYYCYGIHLQKPGATAVLQNL